MSDDQGMGAGGADWAPTASLEMLRLRARLLSSIRRFFAERGVLEVETPVLSAGAALDLHLSSFTVSLRTGQELYLQTSPEFAMKRLLAAGSGPIFQIGKAFREGEGGSWHNPEFTLLEWYRPGFDHHRLMDEVDELARELLGMPPATRMSYAEAFAATAGLQPHAADQAELIRAASERGLPAGALAGMERDALLDFLFSHAVQPGLAGRGALFVYDFPASQAALARVRPEKPPLAERFELLVNGVELANGYHELADPLEQRLRFEDAQARRRAQGLACYPLDERLLAAMDHGLPDCAGVAIGLDRLVMLAGGARRIRDVIAFPISRA